jgi:hypothetical protein
MPFHGARAHAKHGRDLVQRVKHQLSGHLRLHWASLEPSASMTAPGNRSHPEAAAPTNPTFSSEVETRRLCFAARHGVTCLIALGVVKTFLATRATARRRSLTSVRSEDNVSGPVGKKTVTASISVIASSSPHCSGRGLARVRARRSRFCRGRWRNPCGDISA